MYVTEMGKIASDLAKVGTIINDTRFREMHATLESLKALKNIFQEDREGTAELYERFTLAMVELFRALHQIDPQVEAHCIGSMHDLVNLALNHLSFLLNIKGFAAFDCQGTFLKADGIRAFLGIKAYSTADLFPEGIALRKDAKKLQQIQINSKIVMQMLS